MIKKIMIVNFILFVTDFLCAYPSVDVLLSGDTKKELLTEGVLTRAHFDDLNLSLVPKDDALIKTINDAKVEVKPSILIESLCLYNKPKNSSWTKDELTKLFNGIASISDLAGLRYYSNSKKQSRLFYEKSTVIDSPVTKNPLSDPVFTSASLPSALTVYAQQKDLSFGDNIYKLDFEIGSEEIILSQSNLTTMYYGVIPVLGKEKLRSIVSVIDSGDSILVYMVSMADALSFPGLKNRVAASFSARAESILNWFVSKADALYKSDNDTPL
jgi:hypothetical protein